MSLRTEPLVSVVVPTFNRSRLLSQCLKAVFAQNVAAHHYEVIVVDDGSSDVTMQVLHGIEAPCAFQFCSLPNKGAAAARNAGIARARGRIILFLDDDVIAESGLLRAHIAMHESHPRSAVVGPIETVAHGFHPLLSGLFKELQARGEHLSGRAGAMSPFELMTGNCSIEREVLVDLGCFDGSLPSNEDFELGLRLIDRAIPIRYCPDAKASELWSRGLDIFLDGAFRHGMAVGMIVRKHSRAAVLLGLNRIVEGPVYKRVWRRLLWLAASLMPFLLTTARSVTTTANRNGHIGRFWGIWYRTLRAINYFGGMQRHIGSFRELRRLACPRLLILGYHMIDDRVPEAVSLYGVTTDRFRDQMRYLDRKGYRTVTLAEWALALAGKGNLPPRPVVLTFDDGYCDTLLKAWPELSSHGFRGTVFVVADAIGGTNQWDENIGLPSRQLLSIEQLKEIQRAGGEIGSHTSTHTSLPQVPRPSLAKELQGSKDALEEKLGVPVQFLAYPYGNFDSQVLAAVKNADFVGACCSLPGMNDYRTDPYALRRVFISGRDGRLRFRLKASFPRFWGWIDHVQDSPSLVARQAWQACKRYLTGSLD